MSIKRLCQLAMLAAISIVLVFFVRFPILPAAPFLEYTPAEVPIMFAAFLFGPISAFMMAVVVAFIQGFTVSAHSGIIGIAMNILSTGSFLLAFGLVYRGDKTIKRAVIAIIAGVIATTAAMAWWNIIVTPIFMGVPRPVVISMILPVFVPFNLIRAGVNSLMAFLLWKTFAPILKRYTN